MKTKFGAIIVAGSGKIGGHVASRNRAGSYLRTKVTPVNPGTTYQSVVRSRLTDISQDWKALSQAQRDSWNNAVQSFSKTDIFGDIKNPTGFNLFQRLNNNLAAVGGAAITSPPLPTGAFAITALSLVADLSSTLLTITFSPTVPTGMALKVFATPLVSPGVSFVKSEFRLITTLPATTTSPQVGYTTWNARFGLLVVGQKIFVKLVPVNAVTGEESSGIIAQTIVVA